MHWYSHAPLIVHSAPQQPNSDRGARQQRRWERFILKPHSSRFVRAHHCGLSTLIWTPLVLICGRLFTEGIHAITERQM